METQGLRELCLEAIWHARFELIFAVVTAACYFLSRLAPRVQPRQESKYLPRPARDKRVPEGKILTPMHHEPRFKGGSLSRKLSEHSSISSEDLSQSPRRSPARRDRLGAKTSPQTDSDGDHRRALARQAARMILAESRRDNGRPLEMHQDALTGGTSFAALPEAELQRFYLSLTLLALRAEQGDAVVPLLQDMQNQEIVVPSAILVLVVKRCAQRRFWNQCFAAYRIARRQLSDIQDRDFWSAMLLASAEVGDAAQCDSFWQALVKSGEPVAQDYTAMVRVAAHRNKVADAVRLTEAMHAAGFPIEPTLCNLVVSTCVSAQQLEAARGILTLEQVAGDIVAYNTLLKGYAFAQDLREVMRLYATMQERGAKPTQVTFGILLDACVSSGDLEHAAEVFHDMIASGCAMNTVLYTTLIKGLARAGRVDKAMEVYRHMQEQSTVKADTILFSVLIKANCDAGRMEGALRVFTAMRDLGCRPDEIVFNTLLAGCVRDSNLALGRTLLEDMASVGVRPSHATVSVLIKLYAKCHLLEEAQRLLVMMPEDLGLVPELRLFVQLIHACLRERQGRRAIEVYRMMAQAALPDAGTNASILGTCLNVNMVDTAHELLEVCRELSSEVSEANQEAVLQALEKRRPRDASMPLMASAPVTAAVPGAQRKPKYRGCYLLP